MQSTSAILADLVCAVFAHGRPRDHDACIACRAACTWPCGICITAGHTLTLAYEQQRVRHTHAAAHTLLRDVIADPSPTLPANPGSSSKLAACVYGACGIKSGMERWWCGAML